jgi:hypothetical protein
MQTAKAPVVAVNEIFKSCDDRSSAGCLHTEARNGEDKSKSVKHSKDIARIYVVADGGREWIKLISYVLNFNFAARVFIEVGYAIQVETASIGRRTRGA